jgi:hypothetical protein
MLIVEHDKEGKDKHKQPTPEAKQKINEIKNQRANKFQTLKFIKPAPNVVSPPNKKVAKTDDAIESITVIHFFFFLHFLVLNCVTFTYI